MGNFYRSFTVRGTDHESVVKVMKGRTAAISPNVGGFTVVWDAECEKQDESLIDEMGKKISSLLKAPVISFLNHDDDILWYGLYSAGAKIDQYNSSPEYFEGGEVPPSGGNTKLLMQAMSAEGPEAAVDKILRDTEYVFAVERHLALLAVLGMPAFAAFGYRYISRGEVPEGLAKDDLTLTE